MHRNDSLRETLAKLIAQEPGLSTNELAERVGITRSTCYGQLMRLKRQKRIRIQPGPNFLGQGFEYRYFPRN